MNRYILILLSFIIILSTSGCVTVNKGKKAGEFDGGVFKSVNRGTGWQQKVLIPTVSGAPRSFAAVSASVLAVDPSDRMAIYLGTELNGLFYTYDGGNNWQPAGGLGKVGINAIAIDPVAKCTIYAAVRNLVYKSDDCSRNWSQVYYDNDLRATVNTIAIDHFNSANLYIGLSRGDIIKSTNHGGDWQTIYRISDRIEKIFIDPNDSRKVYVTTNGRGVYYSEDNGIGWNELISLKDAMKDFKLGTDIKDITITSDESKTIFLATYYGLLRSTDGGGGWEKIELIPTEKKATINAIAVNSKNAQEIYYVTHTTFYRSSDGGENWATIKLPTTRAGWNLIVDSEEPNVIYLGVKGFNKR